MTHRRPAPKSFPRSIGPGAVRTYPGGRPPEPRSQGPQLALPMSIDTAGELRTYRFTLPYLPPSKNQYDGMQPQWQASLKRKWLRNIRDECDALDMPRGLTKLGLAAVLVFPINRVRDPQNYASTLWNFVPDALQKSPKVTHETEQPGQWCARCAVLVNDQEGAIQIGANWGLSFRYDMRKLVDKKFRSRTVIAVTMRVPAEMEA